MPQPEPLNDSSARPSVGTPVRKRPVSERRIQANRLNALRSTGPTTARGKRAVARNAIKHGFLAREVVIAAGDGKESLEEFHDLLERLCEEYEPVGVVEESLVQTIATCLWRKARVIRAENGEIRKRLDTLAVDRALRISDEGNLNVGLQELELGLFSADNSADDKVSSRDAEARSFSLPPAFVADKLLRYEAHLDRQLYRAMDQLERLQRQRKGETLPPPLHISLEKRR
jgi:hypothetical protein